MFSDAPARAVEARPRQAAQDAPGRPLARGWVVRPALGLCSARKGPPGASTCASNQRSPAQVPPAALPAAQWSARPLGVSRDVWALQCREGVCGVDATPRVAAHD